MCNQINCVDIVEWIVVMIDQNKKFTSVAKCEHRVLTKKEIKMKKPTTQERHKRRKPGAVQTVHFPIAQFCTFPNLAHEYTKYRNS